MKKKTTPKKYNPVALTPTSVSKLPNVTKTQYSRTFGFTGIDRGLRIKKFHDGRMNWYISYKFNENPIQMYHGFMDSKNAKHFRLTIGTYPDMDMWRAREMHEKFKHLIGCGVNPKDMKNRNLDIDNVKVKELAEIYFEKLVQDNAKSIRTIKSMVTHNYGDIADLYVDSITSDQIQSSIDRIIERGSMSSARTYHKYLRTMFNIAVDWKSFKMKNKPKRGFTIKEAPVPKVEKLGKRERAQQKERNASRITFKDINLLVNDENIKLIDRIHMKLVISTGQRLTQIREATRDEIDLEDGWWKWAPSRMKKLETHDIPLTDLHISLIKQAYAIVDNRSNYLFPAVRDERKPIFDHALPVAIADHQLRLGKTEGFFKAKHFRHMFKTECARMGLDRDNIDRVQHHSTEYGSAEQYDHYLYADEKRKVLEAWCKQMEKIFAPDWEG